MRGNASNAAGRGIEAALAAIGSSNREPCCQYASLLRQCADSRSYTEGRRVHEHIARNGFASNSLLVKSLVHMYGKCGSVSDARRAFDSCPNRGDTLWAAMITAYAKNGHRREALEMYNISDIRGSNVVSTSALSACTTPEDLRNGRMIHGAIVSAGIGAESDILLSTAIFSMYARCGSIGEARKIFDKMPTKDEVCYTIMISASTQHGQHREALELYREMGSGNVFPSDRTYACVLRACSGLRNLELGKEVHRRIIESQIQLDVVLENAILSMYAKCGDLGESLRLFQGMKSRTVATWNAMITAYVHHQLHKEALELYHEMDVHPTAITFNIVLGACCSPSDLEEGKKIHTRILDCGIPLHSDVMLQNMLVTMYGKCGSVLDAEKVFRNIRKKNVFSWTSMLTVYAYQGRELDSIELFKDMEREGRAEPDPITYTSVLVACNSIGDLEQGKRIHELVDSRGVQSSMIQTALIDLYGKWGRFQDAVRVFNGVEEKDGVALTAMVSACVHHHKHAEALQSFFRMEQEGFRSSSLVYSLILTACSHLGEFEKGKQIESRVVSLGLKLDQALEAGILGLYIRCSDLSRAREAFDRLACKSVVSWRNLMGAYNEQKRYKEALELYKSMDVEPDAITFLHALDASRDLEQGRDVHRKLLETLEMNPSLHTAVIDMFVRCGDLEEARAQFDSFPEKDVISWTSLASAYNLRRQNAEALKLFRRMDLEGVEPDSVAYCSAIDSCTGLLSLRHGREVHSRVALTGHLLSSLGVKEALVNMYCRFGRLELAGEIFQRIEPKTWVSMRTMLAAYAQYGHSLEALRMFNQMSLEGFKTFTNL